MEYRLSLIALVVAILSIFFFDYTIADFFHTYHHKIFKAITAFGDSAPYLIISLLLFILYKKSKPLLAKGALFIFLSVAISGIITDIIKIIIGRPRPKLYLAHNLTTPEFFKFKASFWSMPSGHTTTAFAVATAFALLFPKYRYFFFFMAFLVGLSRIALDKHYLSDVIVGAIIGVLSTIVLYRRLYGTAA
ncbi:phosphatase PAP2 family protein [Nitratiruptor sp. YY09-18]|uniref:phosphatase PAP2 family protein n=1 Tax=Nitratiruptor sp. YY09-18 TaxID=2724901 RepID=UPI001914EDA6|nr:phosphatase PAP2 family protein [Nitratiruptor sp. YY09-18]BCD67628.1 lipid A 4'-phosphatase [Nitratiruptor sp. YY09-18]